MFHVSLLEPAKRNATADKDTDIQPENDLDVYKVGKILDTRTTTSGQ